MKEIEVNPVFILGSGINALGVIRSFAKIDLKPILINYYKDYAMYSRHTKWKICPYPHDSIQLLEFLINLSRKFPKPPVLFITSDIFLDFIIKNIRELEKHFLIPIPKIEPLQKLLVKETMYQVAESANVPCPKTLVIESFDNFKDVTKKVEYPFIIKPSINIGFSKIFNNKIVKVENKQEFREFMKTLNESPIRDEVYVIQEYIDGYVEDLYTITSYADKNHEVVGYSIGHKIRQYPPETGTITSGKIIHNAEILESARKFIKYAQFTGISNIEFKKDKSDGKFKLMEINPRTGLWNFSALKCGVNLPLMAYNEILGKNITPQFNHESSIIWLNTPVDLYYSVIANRKRNYKKYAISFPSWLKSIKGKKVDASFSWKDPLPFFIGAFHKYK